MARSISGFAQQFRTQHLGQLAERVRGHRRESGIRIRRAMEKLVAQTNLADPLALVAAFRGREAPGGRYGFCYRLMRMSKGWSVVR